MKLDVDHCSISKLILDVAVVDDCEGLLRERRESNESLRLPIAITNKQRSICTCLMIKERLPAAFQALKLGQHPPVGIGAVVTSGQSLTSIVQ